MQSITQNPTRETPTPNEPTTPRLRTVTGNRFPRKCACGCGHAIPRDPEVRYVVDFRACRAIDELALPDTHHFDRADAPELQKVRAAGRLGVVVE